jgi:hypothetical protein
MERYFVGNRRERKKATMSFAYCSILTLLFILCFPPLQDVTTISVEDLEDTGFYRLGHQKRLLLAIRRVRDLQSAGSGAGRSWPGPMQHPPPPEMSTSGGVGHCGGAVPQMLAFPGKPPAPPQSATRPGGLFNSFQQQQQQHFVEQQHQHQQQQQQQLISYHPDILRIQQHHHHGPAVGGSPCSSPLPSRAAASGATTSSFASAGGSERTGGGGHSSGIGHQLSDDPVLTGIPEPMPPLQYPFFHHPSSNSGGGVGVFQPSYHQQQLPPSGGYPGSPRFTPRAAGGLGAPPSPSPWRMLRSYDDADILRHADHSVLIHEAPRPPTAGRAGAPAVPGRSGTLPRPKVRIFVFTCIFFYHHGQHCNENPLYVFLFWE